MFNLPLHFYNLDMGKLGNKYNLIKTQQLLESPYGRIYLYVKFSVSCLYLKKNKITYKKKAAHTDRWEVLTNNL